MEGMLTLTGKFRIRPRTVIQRQHFIVNAIMKSKIKLTRFEKLVAQFAILNGVLTVIAATLLPLVFKTSLPGILIVIWLLLGSGSLFAGCFGLAANAWGYWLLFIVFLIQIAEYYSQTFFFGLIGPLSIKFGWNWLEPPHTINVNLLAIVICCVSICCALSIGERSNRASAVFAEK